jgi:AcrR family transcriptional regulator
MAARGSYAKGVAKRDEILTTALEVIATNGYHKTTIRDLAAAVGLSQAGLLHYFGSKEELFVEILRRRDKHVTEHGSAVPAQESGAVNVRVLIDGLVDVGRQNAEVPGLVQLFQQFSTEATEAGHPAHQYFRERYADYRRRVATSIREQQDAGGLPPSLDPERAAALIAAATDGLQTQWMLDPSIDMAEHIRYLWSALSGDIGK